MHIPSYQIQNVLKVYSKQLSQQKFLAKNKTLQQNTASSDSVTISSKGKRQAIIEKVATNIINKIIMEGPREPVEETITSQIEKELGKKIDFTKKTENKFTYTYIDEDDKKVTKSLSVEDSNFVMQRMTELATQVADSNMEL
ncbi:MAG: hypothetical protein K8R67_18730 [Desulfobacteraceae bacterium]|nr:hypothetical protein [Desulfobacteraceae bacterium]